MDELQVLRSVRSDVPEMTAEAFEKGRAALVVRAEGEPGLPRVTHAPRRWRWAGIGLGGTVVAAGIAAALVLSNVAGWHGADPAAADVLHAAAARTINETDPAVAAGQYLKVSTEAITSATVTGDGATESYLERQTGELYVPSDHADDWIWQRTPRVPYKAFTADAQRVMNDIIASDKRQHIDQDDELLRAPGGAFYGVPAVVSDKTLAALPQNGRDLLQYVYRATKGKGHSPDAEAFDYIADLLRSGLVPAQQRATLYDAVALIPGVSIADKQATLDGRTGVALGHAQGARIQQQIIIDPATGLLIGERQVALEESAAPGIPVGTAIESTAVTTTVVDAAPSGGTACGTTSCSE